MPYWKNTASEEMIENSFLHADEQSKLDIISLYENGKLRRKINMQMTLDKHFSNDIISLLVASGYLNAIKKIDHKTYELEIVNNEIKETYEDLISKYVKDSAGVNEVFVKSLVRGFEDNNLKLLNIELKEIAKNTHYYLKRYEASYHAMLFAMLSLDNSIGVKCEVDAGYGRIDLVIYFKSHKCLIEIKKCTQNETIENKFIELTEQIDVKEYRSIMEPQDTIYGIVFANDEVDVRKL
jgi:hypothetical protein